MTKHGVTIAIMGGICALALAAAATPVSAGTTAYLSRFGSGSTCSQFAPCADMVRRARLGNTVAAAAQHGLLFQPNGPATLHITETVFYNNNGGSGVLIKPSSGGSANVHIRNVRFEHNLHGLFADGTNGVVNVNMAESAAVDNQANGIGAFTGSAPVTVSVTTSQITGNFTNGIGVLGTGGAPVAVKIGNSQITGNVTGIATAGAGQILTRGGNDLDSNGSDGTFTGSIAKK